MQVQEVRQVQVEHRDQQHENLEQELAQQQMLQVQVRGHQEVRQVQQVP